MNIISNVVMSIKTLKVLILGLALSYFIYVLSACTPDYIHMPIELRDFPAESRYSHFPPFPGDTQEKVLSVLGEPLIDAKKLGIQVFHHIAPQGMYYETFDIHGDVHIFTLVSYDESDSVNSRSHIRFPWESSTTLNGFSFVGIGRSMPQTLLGPPFTSKKLLGTVTSISSCTIIFLFTDCPMAKVSVDNVEVIDLGFLGSVYCRQELDQRERREHNYYGTYIKKEIPSGSHKIEMRKGRWDKKFETNFECDDGETIFTEFAVKGFEKSLWHGIEPVGVISIHKSFPESVIEEDTLRPILWHGGVWYGPPGILSEE